MKTASFVVLLLVGVATLLLSLASAVNAYGRNFSVGPLSVTKIEALAPGMGPALRGARGTAAAFAMAYSVLWIAVVLVPYRRGETWAWWALLGAAFVYAVVVALRVPLAGTRPGAGVAIVNLVLVLVGLGLDFGRLRGPKP